LEAGLVLKVVIIDDSLAIQRSLGRLLASIDGVEVAGFAENVLGALTLVDTVRPDVVVLDVNLRNDDKGIDVLHHVKRQQPEAEVVVVSNTASPRSRERYLGAGASMYFDKASEFMRVRDWVAARVPQR
jgi:DNA-binding NarL/FixJ family response regulator